MSLRWSWDRFLTSYYTHAAPHGALNGAELIGFSTEPTYVKVHVPEVRAVLEAFFAHN